MSSEWCENCGTKLHYGLWCAEFYQRHDDPALDDEYYQRLADAVLPVVQAHTQALRDQIEDERNAHARAELLADSNREAARDELAALRDAVSRLADELERSGLHGLARRLRSLLGDKEQG